MSDVNLHGVLNMPPELWGDSEIDKMQRYDIYRQASRRIEDLSRALVALSSAYSDWPMNVHDEEELLINSMLRQSGYG
jgi:hypothetical protein